MKATALIFPRPKTIRENKGHVTLPRTLALTGEPIPDWLRARLAKACRRAGVKLRVKADAAVAVHRTEAGFSGIKDETSRTQAYNLAIHADGSALINSPGSEGLQYAIVTLSLILEAAGAGAALSPVFITDAPVLRVRGVQLDMAREFFPSVNVLKKIIDRCVDLKLNTLWLYLENHFRAPGLEDISPKCGMTPGEAHEIGIYGATRGMDVVPVTNVLSHMEGWFRLERYSDFADGASRRHPVLTRKESLDLVKKYIDELIKAFPSRNIHIGLDEFLFTGTNPEAEAAIKKKGKPAYFADFALKIVNHVRSKGKTVWVWDDMILGTNIFRKEGFNQDYRKALDRFPRDVVMTHWYYSTDFDGRHSPIIERVGKSGRPFVVAPSCLMYRYDYGLLSIAVEGPSYMALCGRKHGAFGLINTHWESRHGCCLEAGWPLLVIAAGFAWSGGRTPDATFFNAFSFTLTGDTNGELVAYLRALDGIQEFLHRKGIEPHSIRSWLFQTGPHQLWRRLSPRLRNGARAGLRQRIATARQLYGKIGARDRSLKQALYLPVILFEEALNIVEAFDKAWSAYHSAALVERDATDREAFKKRIEHTIACIDESVIAVSRLRRRFAELEKNGHTPYDSYALGEWVKALRGIAPLIRACVKDDNGLPYFEKLLYLPDSYHVSNLKQIQVQNTFHARHGGRHAPLPWPVRGKLPE